MDPSVVSGLEEPGGAQVSVESQEDLTSGLDVGECEKRAREMLGVGGSTCCWGCSPTAGPSGAPPPLGAPHVSPPPLGRGPSRLGLTVSHTFALKNWRHFWRQVPSNLPIPKLEPLVPSQGELCCSGESTERKPLCAVRVPAPPPSGTAAKPAPVFVPLFLHLSREGGAGWTLRLGGLRFESRLSSTPAL